MSLRIAISLALAAAVVLSACAERNVQSVPVVPSSAAPTSTVGVLGSNPMASTGREEPVAPPTSEAADPLIGLAYTTVVGGVDAPMVLTAGLGDSSALVALKDGQVARLEGGELDEILDVSSQVVNRGEQGLLGMALHPTAKNRLFLHYSDARGDTVVSEFALPASGVIDRESERVLFTATQPAGNHNGGWIQFGPDGALYLGLGDGGGAGDQFGNGQNDDTFMAGLVRIDIDTGEAGKFAKGLRNPWRFWIDGTLVYIADVGQNAYEEISVAPLEPNLNYGWSIMEGLHCYSPSSGCSTEGLVIPVVEVSHGDAGTCSITGGVVYRGAAIPELVGHYLYSDYCGGYLRSLRYDTGAASDRVDWTTDVGVPGSVASFGVDGAGEVYVLTIDAILRIDPIR